jgi:two-component system response regulator (stage 0 sporulation protein A)
MKNILVVDDNTNFVNMLIRYFKNNPKINIKYIGEDGEKGLKILIEHKDDIDLILLDLVMPKKDGLYFLKEFKKLNLRKNIIVMTSLNSDTIIRKVSNYQVDDFILKPYSFEDLETKLMESVTSKRDNKDVKQELSKLLHELGIPSNIKGYEYLREAIINLYNAKNISGITKELYPDIASKYDTSPTKVERAIRHAIEVSSNRGDIKLMDEIFGHSVDMEKSKPTNSEFIVTIADKLKLEKR